MKSEHKIRVDSDRWTMRVFWFCLGSEALIGLADLCLNYFKWLPSRALRRAVNITREDSIGNWFSSVQALVVGIVLLMLFLDARAADDGRRRAGWGILAAFFAFMAIDDATKLHERIGTASRSWFGQGEGGGESFVDAFPTYAWHLVVAPFFVAMGIYMLWFLWRELDAYHRPLVLAAFSCLAVAVGLDFLEGMDLPGLTSYDARHTMKLVEELLEMLGITFFLVTFLRVLLARVSAVRIDIV